MNERPPAPDLSLLRLRVFAAVVEQGGYSAAARSLALSQPTVSFHVQALERAFATQLVIYRGRRLHLTAAGEALYGLARRMLRDAEDLTTQIAGIRAGKAGRLRLGASMAFEQAFFFETVVAPYIRDHPEVDLSLSFGTSRQMIEAVRAREVDLAYVMHRHPPPDVRYLPLHTSRVVFFVADRHPLAEHRQATAEAVGAAGLITVPLDTSEWEHYSHALHQIGLHEYEVALEVTGIQARILAAQAGLGVLVIFWPPYARDLTLPGLSPIDLTGGSSRGPQFGLVDRAEESAPPAVGAFTTWLRRVVRHS